MKKEILFRGKDSRTNKWVYGWFVPILGETDSILVKDVRRNASKNMTPFTYSYSQVKASTIGQYIGIKDKNGTKIFEGDILSIEFIPINCDSSNYYEGEVLFLQDTGLFALDLGYGYLSFNTMKEATGYIYSYEVTGNVHDTSTL